MLPTALAAHLDDTEEELDLPGVVARDDECCGAKFHSPSPLVLREVELNPWGGPSETALLCGTCADNLSLLQALLGAAEGELDWPVRRDFGNLVRALALRGWNLHVGSEK